MIHRYTTRIAFLFGTLALYLIIGHSFHQQQVQATSLLNSPTIAIDPEALSATLLADEQASYTLTISNTGTIALNWSIEEAYGPTGHSKTHLLNSWSEDFDDVSLLPGLGWVTINNSEPLGTGVWSQGTPNTFPAHLGAPNSYIAASYQSAGGAVNAVISNWLLTPEITMNNNDVIRFWTRHPGDGWADRLQVRLSANGNSADVGNTAHSVGDFTQLLLDINPEYDPHGYPEVWTEFTVVITGLAGTTNGRIGFRYFVEDGGPWGDNSDYVGIDTLSYTAPCVSPADVSWLTVDPTNGSILPGASTPVTVTLDSTGLAVGVYSAYLCVTSDDPDNPVVQVPVTLNATVPQDPPVIAFDPTVIDTAVAEGSQTNQILTISNNGEEDLDWLIEESDDNNCAAPSNVSWLTVNPTSGITPADAPGETLLTFDATSLATGTHAAYLCITSNDPATPLASLPITLTVFTPPDPAVIDLQPTALEATQLANIVTTHPLTISNMGEADLTWLFGMPTALYDNGPFITSYGDGPGGADVSLLQDNSLGLETPGYGSFITGVGPQYRIADEFTVTDPGGWQIDQIRFYAYERDSSTTSTMISVNYRIWNGNPKQLGSSVIYGDTTTNRIVDTGWTNVYRYAESNSGSVERPIMYVDGDASLHLPPGSYWLDWQLDASLNNEPWQVPISILGEVTTGNAQQLRVSGWVDLVDDGTGTQQGAPFQLWLDAPTGCEDPTAVSWLSLSQNNGVTSNGNPTPIEATLDSTGLAPGVYTTTLCIVNNDPINAVAQFPITLTVSAPPAPPAILVSPSVISGTQEIDTQSAYTMTISNTGGGFLNWSFTEVENICPDPTAVSWLSLSQQNGATLPGHPANVTITLNSTGIPPGVYTTSLCLQSNASNTTLSVVPVTMTVSASSGHQLYLPVIMRP
ncbi:MAG: choice-of-anchor J domain-containing protein [Chloroflexi bacterium]|nr:choice-of-anchor J domain-containing protein [Chloroflexota bacterium]